MTVLVPYPTLLDTVTGVFRARGVPPDRAATAAETRTADKTVHPAA